MAENSLFAILLRSRWWISLAVAALIIVLCMALLPQEAKFVGSMGSLPFIVIGAMALKRQWKEPSPAQARQLLEVATALSARDFSQRLQAAWRAEGYEVQPCGHPAADWILSRAGKTTWVLARRYKAGSHGVEPLRALQQAADEAGAATTAYVLLQGSLSENAAALAKQHSIVVLQDRSLALLLSKAR
ncbi:restriction endonuclease [Comamonas composti]|uniref:restriction endonuclease n=1 Tax=Comamonas composti TaxID=408558 RepID=UPI0004227067|nr:restriction endonuclease [Comamonas composti]